MTQGTIECTKLNFNLSKEEVKSIVICRSMIGKCNNLNFEEGINMDGEANKLVEVEIIFQQGEFIFSNTVVKGTMRLAAFHFEGNEKEMEVFNTIYNNHMNQFVEKYSKAMILTVPNAENIIEHSELENLERVIQRNPNSSIRYWRL
jgi:hypothetical protein